MSQYIIDQPAEQGPATPAPVARVVKLAEAFGDDDTCFLWYPYLPIGDYSVLMAEGGTGKTILCCGIAAAISAGQPLPETEARKCEGKNVLIISGEDSGEVLKKRLAASNADLTKVFVLDRETSIGLNLDEGYEEFETIVKSCGASLVILDPWHSFLGADININKVNAVRPLLQRIANLSKKCKCSVVLVSHVNKRAQTDNINNAAIGSADFINASRSAIRVIFDDTDRNIRTLVHTKSNYAPYGPSLKYCITDDGGVEWSGTSLITRQTLEEAARRRATPGEVAQYTQVHDEARQRLVEALEDSASESGPKRYSYNEFKQLYGDSIFEGRQPARAMKAVASRLVDDGYILNICSVRKNGKTENGFLIQRKDTPKSEQIEI